MFKDGQNIMIKNKHQRYGVVMHLKGEASTAMKAPFQGGSIDDVKQGVEDYRTLFLVDIPVRLPIGHKKANNIIVDGEKIKIHHEHIKRGEELFDSFDSALLPEFSRLRVFIRKPIKMNYLEALQNLDIKYETTIFLEKVVSKYIQDINEASKKNFKIPDNIFSYEIHYFKSNNTVYFNVDDYYGYADISTYIYYDGTLELDDRKNAMSEDEKEKLMALFLQEKFKVEEYFSNHPIKETDFIEKVDKTIEEFSYYGSQTSKALHKLDEERIRDIFLISVKMIFNGGFGEVFNYDGKSDFIIQNPDDKYSYVAGELKYWSGLESFKSILYQGREKHSTGREDTVYLIVLSTNVKYNDVVNQILDFLVEDSKIKENSIDEIKKFGNNKMPLYEVHSEERLGDLRIVVSVMDLYFKAK